MITLSDVIRLNYKGEPNGSEISIILYICKLSLNKLRQLWQWLNAPSCRFVMQFRIPKLDQFIWYIILHKTIFRIRLLPATVREIVNLNLIGSFASEPIIAKKNMDEKNYYCWVSMSQCQKKRQNFAYGLKKIHIGNILTQQNCGF